MRGPQERMLNREIPMPEFMRAIRGLNAPETPVELNLTPAQRESLAAIAREHAQATRQHFQAHREEIAGLAETLGFEPMELERAEALFTQRLTGEPRRAATAARNGAPSPDGQGQAARPRRARESDPSGEPGTAGGPDTTDAMAGTDVPPPEPRRPEQIIRERVGENPTPAQRGALERLRKIRESGPSGLEAQTRVWNSLTPPQQQFVLARVEEGRARVQAERGEMYVQDLMQREGAGLPAEQREVMAAAIADPGSTAERLHRLIDRLTPQQQERLLRYVETRLAQAPPDGGPAPARRQDSAPGRRPPPVPRMDEVDVPSAGPV